MKQNWWCHAYGRSPTAQTVQWWTTAEKRTAKQRKKKWTGEHNGRSSISLLYLFDVRNTLYACSQKHAHLSARRQPTRTEKRLILAQSFNQAVCMSHMLSGWYLPWYHWQGNRCAAQGQNHNQPCGLSVQAFISSSELQQSQKPWDSAPISSGRVSALGSLMKTDEAAGESWENNLQSPISDHGAREVTWPIKSLPFIPTACFICIWWIWSQRERERESKQIYRAHFTHIEFHIKSFCIFERLTYLILTLLQAVIGLSVTLNRLAPVHRHFKKHWEGKCRSESISLKISWWCVSGTQRAVCMWVTFACVCIDRAAWS